MKPHFKRMRDQAIREAEAERVEAGACMLLYCLVGRPMLLDYDGVGDPPPYSGNLPREEKEAVFEWDTSLWVSGRVWMTLKGLRDEWPAPQP